MHLNRNLNTVFYAVIAVLYGKEYFKVFTKISLFVTFSGEKRGEKFLAGHESDKLIESYSEQPTIEQQFESSSIIGRFMSLARVNSGQFNLLLQMGLIISSTFSFYDFLSFHHPQQQIQVLPTPH